MADAAFAANPRHFFNNIFRKQSWVAQKAESSTHQPSYNVSLMNMLDVKNPPGEPLMSDKEMDVFVEAFTKGGFTSPINGYRNITRNWEISADLPQRIDVPCGMIYGKNDIVPKAGDLSEYVPNL